MFNPAYEEVPFDPYDLRPLASLNRRRFLDLPGTPPEWVGRTATELVSKRTLLELIRGRLDDTITQGQSSNGLLLRFNGLLSDPGSPGHVAARAIAAEHGRRLGYLLASIRRSRQGITDPLLPWEAEYLRFWREEVDQIFLGGGLASPPLGELIAAAAGEILARCGQETLRLRLAEHPSRLPMLGAARCVRGEVSGAVLTADFGGSQAKRGIAYYGPDHALQLFAAFPSLDVSQLTGEGQTAELAEKMAHSYADLALAARTEVVPQVVCSVGAYVDKGQPAPIRRGTYTALNDLQPDAAAWFAQRIDAVTGQTCQFTFLHDCDAAACALAGRPRSAVLMLGSSLGVGFVPPAERCQPLAGGFKVVEVP